MKLRRQVGYQGRGRAEHGRPLTSRYVTTPHGITRIRHGGHGAPTAVFIGGVGEGLNVWDGVLPGVADLTAAWSYDRLGLGHSAPARARRDSAQVARELHELLLALREREPVLLVSHSAGAFHARVFAREHPAQVAGMLFVEPSHEDWLRELREADRDAWLRHMQWRHSSKHPPGRKQELAAWDESIAQIRSLGPELPDVPVTIVSATAGHSSATDVLFRLHQRWLESLPEARHVITNAGGHHIQKDAPEIIVREVEALLHRLSQPLAR